MMKSIFILLMSISILFSCSAFALVNSPAVTHSAANYVQCANGRVGPACPEGQELVIDTGWNTEQSALTDFADFERENFVVRPSRGTAENAYLWQHIDNGENDGVPIHYGTLSYQAGASWDGSTAARIVNTPDPLSDEPTQPYLKYYSYTESPSYSNSYIRDTYARESGTSETWQLDTYNRFKFAIKPDSTATWEPTTGQANLSIGTFTSDPTSSGPTSSNAEVGGTHWYHRYLVKAGVWNVVVWDTFPNHDRGASDGATHYGDKNYWMGESTGYNYADSLTGIYVATTVDGQNGVSLYDGFVFYEDTSTESHSIYAMAGAYDSSDSSLYVSWARDKSLDGQTFDIVYAFSDIHALGWDNATTLVNDVGDFGYQGYSLTSHESTGISAGQNNFIYAAVRMDGETLFKQIKIPTGMN